MSWTRHGECNGCGFCCKTFKRDVEVRPADAGDQAFYQARGFKPVHVDGVTRLVLFGWMQAPCLEHSESGCGIYATRPETCRTFPRVPIDIVATPCSYWFTKDEIAVGGDASPYPTTLPALLALES